MARAGTQPIADPHRGRAKFAEHLPRVLGGRTLEELGWRMPNGLTLFVPVSSRPRGEDEYLVRLGFEYYAEWPPTACFVNPETLQFDHTRDQYWLPRIEADPGFAVHASYQGNQFAGQLICCSFTAEFYLIQHGVQPEHVWDSERYKFGATIHRIQRALRSAQYRGRMSPKPDGAAA